MGGRVGCGVCPCGKHCVVQLIPTSVVPVKCGSAGGLGRMITRLCPPSQDALRLRTRSSSRRGHFPSLSHPAAAPSLISLWLRMRSGNESGKTERNAGAGASQVDCCVRAAAAYLHKYQSGA